MKIRECYRNQKQTFSFEFFPPKSEEGEARLFDAVWELKKLSPSFISVTYGAMGTTRQNTLRIVSTIKKEIGLEAAAHLTCVGHTRSEIESVLYELRDRGIENIVALRGDPPRGETEFKPVPDGFRYASELVGFIRGHKELGNSFSLAVAGYPECHIECRDPVRDLEHLKMKVDAGADVIITQLFFDNRDYFRFMDRLKEAGISIPVVPGIMPVSHGGQIKKFAGMCGARLLDDLLEKIDRYGDDQPAVEAVGVEWASRQCEELLAAGVPGLHFYTLNKSYATQQIYRNLGLDQKASC